MSCDFCEAAYCEHVMSPLPLRSAMLGQGKARRMPLEWEGQGNAREGQKARGRPGKARGRPGKAMGMPRNARRRPGLAKAMIISNFFTSHLSIDKALILGFRFSSFGFSIFKIRFSILKFRCSNLCSIWASSWYSIFVSIFGFQVGVRFVFQITLE